MLSMWSVWLIIAGFFFVLEIFTTGFLVFWFGIAALITLLLCFIVKSVFLQFLIFVFFSVVLLFATKPLVRKVTANDKKIKTNAFSIEGKTGKVLVEINPSEGQGQIKVDTETWSAKSEDGSIIPKDSKIRVIRIEGVKAIVELVK